MKKVTILLLSFVLSGCASFTGYEDSDSRIFYERKSALEKECKYDAHKLYPGYPTSRGVLTNYGFTSTYDQCMEKKVFNQ